MLPELLRSKRLRHRIARREQASQYKIKATDTKRIPANNTRVLESVDCHRRSSLSRTEEVDAFIEISTSATPQLAN